MKVAVSGYSGFIGRNLAVFLRKNDTAVVPIPRYLLQGATDDLAGMLEGVDVVIHLAGAPIISRWTKKHRQEIYDSRVDTTRKLVQAMGLMDKKPAVFISASGVGIYQEQGIHTESSNRYATDFLGEVCRDWEAEALKAQGFARTIVIRNGIVMGRDGGALKKMLWPFRLGLGGRIASGKQMMSWIHINDLLRAVAFSIHNTSIKGAVNMCAPEPVSNAVFTSTLAHVLRRPALLTVPAFALKLLYGKGSETLTKGQSAIPEKLLQAGFVFQYPNLKEALTELLS
jgi:uncharacterized protein